MGVLIAVLAALWAGISGCADPHQDLDARLVFFDPDGTGSGPVGEVGPPITDPAGLDAFAARYVDQHPRMPDAAAAALDRGLVLVGGVVSSGCEPAAGARLAVVADEVRLVALGDPDALPECVRAVRSIALFAVDPADLPGG
jgi:hypothetical protein